MKPIQTLFLCAALVPACGDDGGGGDDGSATTGGATDGTATMTAGSASNSASNTTTTGDDTGDTGSEGSSGDGGETTTTGGEDSSTTGTDGGNIECDYEIGENGVLMFEAESLPLVDEWTEATDVAGFFGDSYIYWAGPSYNNEPGNGQMDVELGIPAAGRYRLQLHARVGMGSDSTEHNDVWVKFANVADYYGKIGDDPESRRYPRPICEDTDFIDMIDAMPQVGEVRCVEGSSSEGWMKVYSSGAASEWRWSTWTSDSDGHHIYFEVDAPGAYTLQLAARADWYLIDRVVIHAEDVADKVAQSPDQQETPCD